MIQVSEVESSVVIFSMYLQSESPSRTSLLTSGDASAVGVTSLATHPTQAHIVASGASDGSIAFWDLRGDAHPVTILQVRQYFGNSGEVRTITRVCRSSPSYSVVIAIGSRGQSTDVHAVSG